MEKTMIINQYLLSRNFPQQADSRNNLELFKSLLQPHFLFNSLNNLYALSIRRSEQTPEAIAGLSQLLERVVTYSRKDLIHLSEEIELIEAYIALEKIWLGECTFRMDFQVKGDTKGVSIPPLTIYTLIENAFKHGIRKCENRGWITIHLVVKEDKILLKVRNSVSDSSEGLRSFEDSQTGLGIEAVRKLLEGSYHKKYYLNARPIGNIYAVDLIIGRLAA
jgi:LytS/YehU family sensor histidine kinase